MEDVELEWGTGRKKQKINARQGIVIGVVTVAGLGLISKLLSFLRRDEKPKTSKFEGGDIATLEAVLSGDAAKSALPSPTAEAHAFANLENDASSHGIVNGHKVSSPSSKDALDSVSEVAKKDDVFDEVHVTQDLVGDRDGGTDTVNTLTTETSVPSPVHQEEVLNVKDMPHLNGEGVEAGKHQVEDEVELHNGFEGKVHSDDAVTELHDEDIKDNLHVEDEGKL